MKTHCCHGHPLSGGNLYLHPGSGKRACLTCRRAASERAWAKKKAAGRLGPEARKLARRWDDGVRSRPVTVSVTPIDLARLSSGEWGR